MSDLFRSKGRNETRNYSTEHFLWSFYLKPRAVQNLAQRERTAGEYVVSHAQPKNDHRLFVKNKVVKFFTKIKEQAVRWISEEKWFP
jgi:hypothetical protein